VKANLKKKLIILIIASAILMGYLFWLNLRPVEIIAVHNDGNYSSVLVKNFPITDKGKIGWWLKNKERLKTLYDIPKPATYGSFTVIIWLFGEGYKEEEKYDRLCFNDMSPPVNCIEKNRVFSISSGKNRVTIFTVSDGEYIMKDNSKVMKIKNE